MKQSLKFITELAPLLAFFVAYKINGLIFATAVLIFTTAISVLVTYISEKKIPLMLLSSALILTIFGSITIISNNDIFIKLKPTLLNLLFSGILIIGALRKKGLLKYLMGEALKMNEDAWIKFSLRWGIFFLCLAALNELIWRNFSEEFWVGFKVFGMLPLTILFTITQIPFIKKNIETM